MNIRKVLKCCTYDNGMLECDDCGKEFKNPYHSSQYPFKEVVCKDCVLKRNNIIEMWKCFICGKIYESGNIKKIYESGNIKCICGNMSLRLIKYKQIK